MKKGKDVVIPDCVYRLRSDQILQRCIQMIHSHPSSEGNLSHMMFVATHRDLEAVCSETRADKNKRLLEMFTPHFLDQLIYYRPFNEVIFPINAKNPTEEDLEVASKICEQISKFAPNPYKIPVGWFLLEHDIRMLAKRGIISLQECRDIATRLKISSDGLTAALNYLNELNILLYYPSLLPGVIFAEAQTLLNKLTELVAYSYKLRQGHVKEPLTGEWKRFQDEGVVTFQMLQHERFSSHYIPGLFTPTHLVELFKGLLIFAPLTSNQYFMPCLLPMFAAESITRPRSSIAPLLVHFPSKCAQNGVFCALVVHLLTTCKWELQTKDGNLARVSRNCIQFKLLRKPATITLIDSFSFFEVHLNTRSQTMPIEVRKEVFNGLKNAHSKLKYNNSKPEEGFLGGMWFLNTACSYSIYWGWRPLSCVYWNIQWLWYISQGTWGAVQGPILKLYIRCDWFDPLLLPLLYPIPSILCIHKPEIVPVWHPSLIYHCIDINIHSTTLISLYSHILFSSHTFFLNSCQEWKQRRLKTQEQT